MKLYYLIQSHQWLSIQITLLNLYPDQQNLIDEYQAVWEELKVLQPVDEEMQIVLTVNEGDTDDAMDAPSLYIDVSGKKLHPDPNEITSAYALEFVKWEKWLGMDIAPETIAQFTELEIIAHCLYEMTFCGYDQDEIQQQLQSLEKSVEDFKNLSDEEKKQQTMSLEDFLKELDEDSDSPEEE